jgi:hypothetical protein
MGRENQLVGAFGEKAVEAELLRRGWSSSNVNASIKNAADYDIIALKGDLIVRLRVKTCGAGWNAFQFSGFRPGQEIALGDIPDSDYTILVQMGEGRSGDAFYVIPTRTLRAQISIHRRSYLDQPKRDGERRKDLGHWTLHLDELQSHEERASHGFREKWKPYLDNWASLERPIHND